MALEIELIPRKIIFEKEKDKDVELLDIDPQAPLNKILNFHSAEYPEITNGKINGPKIEGKFQVFRIQTRIGTKA